ncbi:RRQRL motif-containing zinc-binding protein [Nocardia sp. CDC153]|uniref:RRQRL motif-containing zinc-binding protein n=1 Tax=Nocardia sp. CDC153 TaxID=3112167 RepID=UPI002DBC7278|nr:RRQRL motif-containing zinc-binding protein [Nocardia sp. CDC153]MEC3957529.1 RRQRL motif-containing zinc-binding protein [Nocardia sp. CDC153]
MIGPKDIRSRDLPDTTGQRFGVPTFYWGTAPDGLATRRQLRTQGMRPNGQEVAAQVLRPRRGNREPLAAYLFRIDQAAPKRDATPAQLVALAKATRTHQLRAAERRGLTPAELDQVGDPGPQWAAGIGPTVDSSHLDRDWGLDR